MRISAKGRYGLAAMISMAQNSKEGEYTTIISISERLGISKIYLEQVFALLKRANLVSSTKGSSGGYRLSRPAEKITAYDILTAIEQLLFEQNKKSLSENGENIENAMQQLIFDKVDNATFGHLSHVTLYDLVVETEKYNNDGSVMFYI